MIYIQLQGQAVSWESEYSSVYSQTNVSLAPKEMGRNPSEAEPTEKS